MNFVVIIVLIAIGVGVYLLINKSKSSNVTPVPPPLPVDSNWYILYSPNMPAVMTAPGDGTHYFDFPTQDGIDYVVSGSPRMSLGQTITMHFALQGQGTIIPTQGDPPAKIRLFFQRAGDNLSGVGEFEHYRWWSVASVDLISPGEYVLTAQLVPTQWSSVYGKNGNDVINDFQAAMANVYYFGFTFGGMFAGHGDYVSSGAVRFVLRDYTLT